MKKGEITIGMMVLLVLGLIVLSLVGVGFYRQIRNTFSEQDLLKCKSVYDIDDDSYIGAEDTCLCDRGKLEDQNWYYLKGERDCKLMRTDDGRYVLSGLVPAQATEADCKAKFKSLYGTGSECTDEDKRPETLTGDGISPSCARKVLELTLTGEPQRTCGTGPVVCDTRFKEDEYCQTNRA